MQPSNPGTDPTIAADTQVDTAKRTDGDADSQAAMLELPPPGYVFGELLGEGGMGEVILAEDRRMGRSVALKRMHNARPSRSAVVRFLREARIQARLDHPAIVPVHELGADSEGRPFFTMKRLAGTTLHDLLAAPDQDSRKLLRAFVDVCLAVEFAHARGVIHRDLKPANIMLGDYGEVYVLDWGIARVLDSPDDATSADQAVATLDGKTEAGALLGTPGYMAPEQITGEPVSPATDVYALGCILFELLVGEHLHPHAGAIETTLAAPTVPPSARRPDVAPELDAACRAALAANPAERPRARALADRIQRFLDGDRDLEQRRLLAAEQYAQARAALDAGDRASAMQTAGRALALDPAHRQAAQLVFSLVLEPPREIPPELQDHLDRVDNAFARRHWRIAAIAMSSIVLMLPCMIWSGIRDVRLTVEFFALICATLVFMEMMRRTGRHWIVGSIILNTSAMIVMTRLFGPFIVVPSVLATQLLSYLSYPTQIARPALPIVMVVSGYLLVFVLEALHWISRSWDVAGHEIVARSSMMEINGVPTTVLLIATNATMLVTIAMFGRSLAVQRHTAQRQIEIQAWHLRKLLPIDA